MSWFDEKHSIDVHAISFRKFICIFLFKIIIKIDHFFKSLLKLWLIPHIDAFPRDLQLTHLGLHLVQDQAHLILINVVFFRYIL